VFTKRPQRTDLSSNPRPTLIERAYEIARSGQAKSVYDVTRMLEREDYLHVSCELRGATLRKTLLGLCKAA